MKLLALIGVSALAVDAGAQSIPGRTLLWADEFNQADGTAPDSNKWGHDLGGGGWGNNELQYYTNRTDNARIEGGNLVIEAKAESYGGRNHTSARLLTKGKASWTYGRMEARIRIPEGQGIWPAFWMLGANIGPVPWPDCGEIDIMENIGSEPSTVHGTIHGPGYSGSNGISGSHTLPATALTDDYHVYAIEWEENRITWFIDGIQYHTLTPANLPGGSTWVFNQPQFLILNVAVGGNWPGNPDASTVFPQRMMVDYVRVYSLGTVTGTTPIAVAPDPSQSWIGYMSVSDLPSAGGAFNFGQPWSTADLSARFDGDILMLRPNSISDPAAYWYAGGGAPGHSGNKIMDASMYVEKSGSLSGRTVTFTGRVLANTLTAAHQAVAFIKDFAPDYSSFNSVTAPLVEGVFSISLTTSAGAGRHVQYGFQTTGVNVWSTDLGPFGFAEVTTVAPDPFAMWMSGFDFSVYTNPDLTAQGDPDGDGRSNLEEFALDGDPSSGAPSGKSRVGIESLADGIALALTLPVLDGAVFDGSPAKTAKVGNLTYRIEGSDQLTAFDQVVSEVNPAIASGLPVLGDGWSYRTFRLDGVTGGPGSRGPSGFLRLRIVKVP